METLPVEVQSLVALQVTSRNDLASLRRVSKHWRDIVSPVLFEDLIIQTQEWPVWELDSRPYESLEEAPIECLQLVKHFEIHAIFHHCLEGRCPYCCYSENQYDLEDDGVDVLSIRLLPLLKQLKPGALRSFSWDVGSCVPKAILGIDGILQREQPDIECLSLNTGAPTHNILATGGNYTLQQAIPLTLDTFQNLRSFSWTGVRTGPELESLRVFLAADCNILETLNLDFIDWSFMNDDYTIRFVSQILSLTSGPSTKSFLALTILSLSAIYLPTDLEATTLAFNFGQLRTLKLHRCKNTHLLLRAIVQAGQSLKLESLDLVIDDFAAEQSPGGSILAAFLRSFNGLQQLYLLVTFFGEITTEQYFESLLCHVASMKRLVYHERTPFDPAFVTPSKDKILSFTSPTLDYGSTGVMHRFSQQSRLESLGCCDSPSQLREILELHLSQQVLRMLHIRCSHCDVLPFLCEDMIKWTMEGIVGPVDAENYSAQAIADFELFDFVRWAFSSKGLPKLRILAFGDFCYDGRYNDQCLLFCRQRIGSVYGFRLASKEDVISLSGIDKPFDFLSACPKEALYPAIV